ncbi:Proteophosphoglycan ppg4 [Meredithblackwellia eburnea MCA 4105]
MSTLAPSTIGAKKGNRLRKPLPTPAGLRPQKAKYQLPVWNLIYVPKRIFVPPKPSVGSVRSFKSTLLSEVRLDDVLANKHLAPLSLKDFEGHLVYREHSAENLYFILWLREYTNEYNEFVKEKGAPTFTPTDNTDPNATRTATHLPEYLAQSLRRGLDAFFAPNGPLELNLSANTRAKTLVEAGNSGNPADFEEAKAVVEDSLTHSLAVHCRNSIANAGPRRLVFCFCLGLTIFLASLIPFFVAIFGHHARAWRAIGLPFMAFGAAVMFMAVAKICGVIWLLGEDRQMQAWELASPTVTSGSLVSIGCPSTPRSSYSFDEESSYGEKDHSMQSANSSEPYPWEKEDAYPEFYSEAGDHGASTVSFGNSTPATSRPASYTTKTSVSDIPYSPPVFGPVTKTFSPNVARAQWWLAVRSLMNGCFVMAVLGAVLMAVPNQS